MPSPTISIIMSAYNAEKHIKQAIESILNQTFSDFEFIIINDFSTDNTLKIIQSFSSNKIKLINNKKNLGLTKSLNLGLKQAQGKYIARLDADDVSEINRLEKQYNFLKENNNIVLTGSWAKIINDNNKKIGESKPSNNIDLIKFNFIFGKPQIFHSSIFFKRKEIIEIGGYNEKYKYSQDLDLYLRLLNARYKITNIPEFLIQHRKHIDSIGNKNKNDQHIFYLQALFNYCNKNYFTISEQNWNKRDKSRNQQTDNLNDLLLSLNLDKKLYKKFIQKENIDLKSLSKIKSIYRRKQQLMIKGYLKNKFPQVYQTIKKIN